MIEGHNAGENLVTKILGWLWPAVWLAIVWGFWHLYVRVF